MIVLEIMVIDKGQKKWQYLLALEPTGNIMLNENHIIITYYVQSNTYLIFTNNSN